MSNLQHRLNASKEVQAEEEYQFSAEEKKEHEQFVKAAKKIALETFGSPERINDKLSEDLDRAIELFYGRATVSEVTPEDLITFAKKMKKLSKHGVVFGCEPVSSSEFMLYLGVMDFTGSW